MNRFLSAQISRSGCHRAATTSFAVPALRRHQETPQPLHQQSAQQSAQQLIGRCLLLLVAGLISSNFLTSNLTFNRLSAAELTANNADGTDNHSAVLFNRDIRPILSQTCFHCHGPDQHGRQAGLRFDTPEGAVADLGGYQPIVPGQPDNSEAWLRIISDDADQVMPPAESNLTLSDDQKALIRRWIEQGADYQGHWAFEPPIRPEPPTNQTVNGRKWGNNPIDAFVLAKIQQAGQEPSPEADPRTLIRRLTFDLTGLPPTESEVRDFVRDYQSQGEKAWQDAISRLLRSKHYGERMAVPWMDQARYADTNGYSIDGGREMWIWRDWVIQAYNENIPFDQFVIEQLAGDLLPGATEAQRIASGFNRNHMVTHEGGTIPEENLTNYAVDRVRTTSEVFLGLTMECAQCHDHKYDPITQRDYYQFFAFFNELSDRGLDGNAGRNPAPSIQVKTVLPDDELSELTNELRTAEEELRTSEAGFAEWLTQAKKREQQRGEGFQLHPVEMLDVSSPNRPGEFSIQPDGSVRLPAPSGGLNAFSHALRLPEDQSIDGIRIRFFPHANNPNQPESLRLTPFESGVPQVTTVLVSAGDQPAKQVDFYRQLRFAGSTASSAADGFSALHVLDERNLQWWKPTDPTSEQHLTLTFQQPLDTNQSPFLSVMVFYGVNQSMPFHWKIESFRGHDTDSPFSEIVTQAVASEPEQWTPQQREAVLQAFRIHSPTLERLRIRIANLQQRIDILTQPHQTMVMDVAKNRRETFVLARGQYDSPQEKVSPGPPSFLPPMLLDQPATRLDLARWMVSPEHPLTSRVAVNRLWSLFFGNGIVATTGDFGSQGEWPSHPELLDYLATELIANQWDQQQLIRMILSSASYRQDSATSLDARAHDPQNRLLARGPRFRLPAEFIRDSALAVSGLLVRRVGGPSVQPYQPPSLWKEVSHFGSTPATKQVFVQDRGEKLYRRSLYTLAKRTSPHPAMSAFDAPNREMCVVQRSVTNTPLQALVTLNDPQFAEAARVFAAKLLSETAALEDRERMRIAFKRVTSRLPNAEELSTLIDFFAIEKAAYQSDPAAAAEVISVGEAEQDNAIDVVLQAAWTQVAALLMNLSETLTRT